MTWMRDQAMFVPIRAGAGVIDVKAVLVHGVEDGLLPGGDRERVDFGVGVGELEELSVCRLVGVPTGEGLAGGGIDKGAVGAGDGHGDAVLDLAPRDLRAANLPGVQAGDGGIGAVAIRTVDGLALDAPVAENRESTAGSAADGPGVVVDRGLPEVVFYVAGLVHDSDVAIRAAAGEHAGEGVDLYSVEDRAIAAATTPADRVDRVTGFRPVDRVVIVMEGAGRLVFGRAVGIELRHNRGRVGIDLRADRQRAIDPRSAVVRAITGRRPRADPEAAVGRRA